jgi:MoxR-like ATPase
VDVLIEEHGKLRVAIEIKSTPRVTSAELTGLWSFAETHPKVELFVGAPVPKEFRLQKARVLPIKEFVAAIDDLLT